MPPPARPEYDSTSRSLLVAAQHDQPAAWERLVKLYAPLVAGWCRRLNVPEQDIADVLQEVFTAVARNVERFRKDSPQDTFRGWLAVIARNKVTDYHRRRSGQPVAVGGTEAGLRFAQVPDCDQDLGSVDLAADAFGEVLRRALAAIQTEFHERTWQAFWGVVVENRSPADVGAQLQMQPGAVRVAKSRVLLRLRTELGDRQA
jgi:RNA polymerase sigma-70 factor (ECF subfamily)